MKNIETERAVFLIDELEKEARILPDGVYDEKNFKAVIKDGKYLSFEKNIDDSQNKRLVAHFSPEGIITSIQYYEWDGKQFHKILGDYEKAEFLYIIEEHSFNEDGMLEIKSTDAEPECSLPEVTYGFTLSVDRLRNNRMEQRVRQGLSMALMIGVCFTQAKCDSDQMNVSDSQSFNNRPAAINIYVNQNDNSEVIRLASSRQR